MPTPQELCEFIRDHLSSQELDDFCFAHFQDAYKEFHQNNWGFSKYVREFVGFCERRGNLDELIARLQIERPKPFQKKFPGLDLPKGKDNALLKNESGVQTHHLPVPITSGAIISPKEERSQLPKKITLEIPVHMEFVLVEEGEFLLGSTPEQLSMIRGLNQWGKNELPQRQIYMTPYYMGKYPVTNEQFKVFAKAKFAIFNTPEDQIDHPVVRVSWSDANAFCEWMSAESGQNIILPSEAQWEKSARGTQGFIFPWGNQLEANLKSLVFSDPNHHTTSVGAFSPQSDSPYGCSDMLGNVWEWCADWYNDYEYTKYRNNQTRNPIGPNHGDFHVLRGGMGVNNQVLARCSARFNKSVVKDQFVGFRAALIPE